jgi:carboxypeptidase family protein
VAFRIILLAFAAAVILSAQLQCLIRGQVSDSEGAAIGNALISVFPKESTLLAFRGNAHDDGTFCIKDLSPGTYTVKAWQNGFRAERVRDVVVRSGETTELGTIQLEVGSCDARGVNCDYFYTPKTFPSTPERIVEVTRADLKLPRECGADLSKGKVICPQSKDVDVVFLEEHDALMLHPVNGARIQPDCNGPYRNQALRVEGLGKGDDLCVKTRMGHESHLFFEGDDVGPTTTKLTLWIVTKQ